MDGPYADLARVELVPARNRRPGATPEQVYRGSFTRWWASATVRRARAVRADSEDAGPEVHFSPELVAVSRHPAVVALGPEAVQELLVRRLYDYLTFTIELESLAVIPVTNRISRGRLGVEIPDAMRQDAFKITTDEAYHAQFSYDLIHQVEVDTGVPYLPVEPAFVRRLDEIRRGMPARVRGLEDVLFAVGSETLISTLLAELPTDDRLPQLVRETIADHALDEGRHHAYFRDLLYRVWPAIHERDRAAVGPWVPAMIRAFLAPDEPALVRALVAVGVDATDAPDVLAEASPPEFVTADVAAGAASAVRYFTAVGALEDAQCAEAFERLGLTPPR